MSLINAAPITTSGGGSVSFRAGDIGADEEQNLIPAILILTGIVFAYLAAKKFNVI